MTLKDFSAAYLPLPDAWAQGEPPRWRKVFPTNLRFHKIQTEPGYRTGGWLFPAEWHEPQYKKVLEEQWERVHRGEIIDTEWRPVYEY